VKYEFDAFNLFNHPSLDSPNTDFALNGCFNPVPCYDLQPTLSGNPSGWGVINGTVGSPRFLQMSLHLTF